jgi:hypothetical protein
VLLHDRVGDREPEAGALANLLGREERVEDPLLHVLGTPAVVVDLEDDRRVLRFVPGADDERAAAVRREHRLLGVDDEVEQHLLQLVRVGEHVREAGRERLDDVDVGDALLVGPQGERLAHTWFSRPTCACSAACART